MGIPKFAYFISQRYPLIVKKIKEKVDVPEIDNFYLDLNSVIHNVSHGNSILISCQKRSYEEIYSDVCDTIEKLFHIIKPKNLLFISVDGVAPRSKMNQQRIRRYKKNSNVNISAEELEIIKEKGIDINNKFNSDAISAGTKFMFDLTTYLKNFIINKKKTDKNWAKIEIILTGADVPGEGEHKILEYIRTFKKSEKYIKNIRHCIYGLDADLVMLALISHEPNIVLLREDNILKKKKQKLLEKKGIQLITGNEKEEEMYEFYLISVLREYLELEFYDIRTKIKFEFNMERILDDFIFLCFFIGNDFLPNLYSLAIESGAMDYLFEFYKDCLPELEGYITEQGKINFSRAKKIFNLLSKKELHSLDLLLYNVKDSAKKNREKRQEIVKEQIRMLKKLKKKEKIEKLKNELNSKTNEEKINFKKNKRKKEIEKIKNIFEKICEKQQKNLKFEEEYEKYRKDPKSFEERKMVIITKAMVDLFADNDEEDSEKNAKKKMKIIKSEIEKKYEEEKEKEKANTEYKPPKVKLTLDSSIKDVLCEALRLDKYIQDDNYCSDFTLDDVSDSDVSDIDTKQIMEEVSKTMEEMNKISQVEKAEDINQQFNEKLLNQYIKNAKEAKAFYYKEKLKIDINTPEGLEEKNKMFKLYVQGLQWVLLYYYQGVKSWRWYYPYNYAPMISDFDTSNFNYDDLNLNNIFENDTSQPYSPFQSLLFILPKTSFDLLPPCYKNFPLEAPEYFPENVDIDYNGKHTPWEAVVLLPFLDEKKVLNLEQKMRNLSKEEEVYNTWGKSFKFEKNEINKDKKATNIIFNEYEIYQNKNYDMISNYDKKKIDYTFPTLKTISYDYSLDNFKTYFGKNNAQKTKRITIHPKLSVKIDQDQIFNFLSQKYIFFGYPYKAFGKVIGIIYDRKYFYLYKGKLFHDNEFRYSNEVENMINNSYSKQGIYIMYPDLLCNIARFLGFKKVNDKIRRNFDESAKDYPFYVPLEVTSLNAVNNDFEKFKSHFYYEFSNDDMKRNQNININIKNDEEKPNEINKLNIKQKYIIHDKFKKFPPELRIDKEKTMKIITNGPINVSEYRENRIFKDENIEEHQIYYFKNPNNVNKVENPYLIIK
jgi:5'-3' exoribonuclease 1